MGLAVAHVIGTIILLDLVRHYIIGKKDFPRYLLVVGGIAALFPDIDIPLGAILSWISGESVNFHRYFTHSLTFVVLFSFISIFLFWHHDTKWAKIFLAISVGLFIHILTDCLYGGFLPMTWPFNLIHSCPSWGLADYSDSIDAIILVLWLVHEEIHNKIRDYI